MANMETLEKMHDKGIQLLFTEEGLKQFARMLQDGCPRHILRTVPTRIECMYPDKEKDSCYRCWYNWLKKHSYTLMFREVDK